MRSSQSLFDQPQPVRPGEELDGPKLEAYLRSHVLISGPLVIEQFPKGYSNLTYLVRAGEQEFVLRRPPFGAKIKTAHDMGREYRILSRLSTVYPRVPRALAYCEDESVLGAPFYVMERVSGIILRAKPPTGLDLSPEVMQQLSQSCITNLAAIHALDYAAAGLGDLGKPEGYVRRQIEGWHKRYLNARTDDISEMDRIAAWLAQYQPAESGACLIHNDYKYDNLVLSESDDGPVTSAALSVTRHPSLQIKAVLDWEMATLGDPLMDLGSTLGYWVDSDDPVEWRQQSLGVTALPGNLNRQQLLEHYSTCSGQAIPNPVFYYAYGLFKIAVIVQQIYARYKQGLTRDERFGPLIDMVRAAGKIAVLAIEKNRISQL